MSHERTHRIAQRILCFLCVLLWPMDFPMHLIFFGTSAFAVPALRALHSAGHTIVAVATQPDRPAGRGRVLTASPIAIAAAELGLNILKPERIRTAEFLEQLKTLAPEIIVTASYGKLLPPDILQLPPQRCVNIHPSLLPRWRWAAPIPWSILGGDTTTGVTTMYMVDALDAGDILLQASVPIAPAEDAAHLHDRLAVIGADLIVQTLDGLKKNNITPRVQDASQVTIARLLTKDDGRIDWTQPAEQIIRQVRALQPWPVAFTHLHNLPLKIFCAEIWPECPMPAGTAPGTIFGVTRSLQIATGRGTLCLTDVQLAGKQRMKSEVFLRGYRVQTGEICT